ncbi:HAD hydrolase-like protein [Actinomyces sp. B33]|nr:HAD hydrolase-like protein [Actinomyces sp. B33]MDC4233366.1 HAD hydrolase-like protein [Actinomyces sp. B33]
MTDAWTCILFDIDGTLVDSAPMVIRAFEESLGAAGLPVPDRDHLRRYVGPPLHWSFCDLGYADDRASALIESYRSLYDSSFLDPLPFPGILDLVAELDEAGYPLGTASSKQHYMAVEQMRHLGLDARLDVVVGATEDPGCTKATVIADALGRLAALGHDVSRPVLVGDSIWDVEGAHEAGIPVIGVGWGYSHDGGLDNADAYAADVDALRTMLLPRG